MTIILATMACCLAAPNAIDLQPTLSEAAQSVAVETIGDKTPQLGEAPRVCAWGYGRRGYGQRSSGYRRGLPGGRTYYNGQYYGNYNNRYYGPQYGYF